MRIATLVSIAALALILVVGPTGAAAQSPTTAPTTSQIQPDSRLATLGALEAVPMAAAELDAVKGLHVHFLDPGKGKLHLAGDIKHENNWYNNGSPESEINGELVAPSYHGLCVAPPIVIPAFGPGGPTLPQCP
jgi:hypothetical protein